MLRFHGSYESAALVNVQEANVLEESTPEQTTTGCPWPTPAEVENSLVVPNIDDIKGAVLELACLMSTCNASASSKTELLRSISSLCSTVGDNNIAALFSCADRVRESDPELSEFCCAMQNYNRNVLAELSQFNSIHQLHRLISESPSYVAPCEIPLGTDTRISYAQKRAKILRKKHTYQYVPIRLQLIALLSNPRVSAEYMRCSDACISACDALRKNALVKVEPYSVQLQLYADELQVTNPLGSRSRKHKLLLVYYTIQNFDQYHNSKLCNIHLAIVCSSTLVKRYGLNSVLEPLVKDIMALEIDGMRVSEQLQNVKVTLTRVCGDNLALHQLFNLSEGFRGKFPCRFCTVNSEQIRSNVYLKECKNIMRTSESYLRDVKDVLAGSKTAKETGVKGDTVFNKLIYFRTAKNEYVDPMHDLLEGVLRFDILAVLKALCEKQLISLDQINSRIRTFPFQDSDKLNKPCEVDLVKLRQSASQMFCLVRLLPLMLGNVIPRVDEHWQYLLLLQQILDVVFSRAPPEGSSDQLEYLIAQRFLMRSKLYPNKKSTPKDHFLTHYPAVLQNWSSLGPHSTFRYEGKHKVFKRASLLSNNYVNVAKTVANKHQLAAATAALSGKVYCSDTTCYTKRSTNVTMPGSESQEYNAVEVRGVKYNIGDVFLLKYDDMPCFAQVVKFTGGITIDAHVRCLRTFHFDTHFHSYVVQMPASQSDVLKVTVDELRTKQFVYSIWLRDKDRSSARELIRLNHK